MRFKNLNIQNFRLLLCVGLMFPIGLAQAKIYKCEKSNGKVYYNDKPCPKNLKETTFENAKDPLNVPKRDNFPLLANDGFGEESDKNKMEVTNISNDIENPKIKNKQALNKRKIGPKIPGTKLEATSNQKRIDFLKQEEQRKARGSVDLLPPLPEELEEERMDEAAVEN